MIGSLDPLPMSENGARLWPLALRATAGDFDGTRAGLVHALRLQSAIDRAYSGQITLQTTRYVDRVLKQLPADNHSRVNPARALLSGRCDYGILRDVHAGQSLCALAESGVSTDFEFTFDGICYDVEDLIREAEQTFSLNDEFEWQAVALALYGPQARSWVNRRGEHISWDDVTRELLRRARSYGQTGLSCGGTHALYALAILRRLNEIEPRSTEVSCADIDEALEAASGFLGQTQLADGSWDENWNVGNAKSVGTRSTEIDRLLITGHHLEWLAIVPRHLRPDNAVLTRAGDFAILTISQFSPDTVRRSPCACSHAMRAYALSGLGSPRLDPAFHVSQERF